MRSLTKSSGEESQAAPEHAAAEHATTVGIGSPATATPCQPACSFRARRTLFSRARVDRRASG
jgi:hypothetical protein